MRAIFNARFTTTRNCKETQIDALYRQHSRRVRATLIRLLGDFDLAEEFLHDAFRAALEEWQSDGVPQQPRALLVSTGRFKAIGCLRRQARFNMRTTDLAITLADVAAAQAMRDGAEAGLALIGGILQRGELNDYHLAYAVRADLCRRLGRRDEARTAYRRALELAQQARERRFLERRLAALFNGNS